MDGCDVTRDAGVARSARSGVGAARGGYLAFLGGFDGVAYRAGKSDTPSLSLSPTYDFHFAANSREKIPMIRSCIAGGAAHRISTK